MRASRALWRWGAPSWQHPGGDDLQGMDLTVVLGPLPVSRVHRRRRALAAVSLVMLAAITTLLAALMAASGRTRTPGPATSGVDPTRSSTRAARAVSPSSPPRLALSSTFSLGVAVEDAACATLPDGRIALLGGLDANDESSTAIVLLRGSMAASSASSLALAQHDAQAAVIDGRVYVFGGGQVSSYDHILSYDPASGAITQAGTLPGATSDATVATVGGTAYVVGGYDGSEALDTIVAWRPGAPARVVARLPHALRYAAAASVGGYVVIAGGTEGEAASRAELRFDPATGAVTQIGRLPAPVTHAAAVSVGGYVYVVGGRAAALGSQTAAITAVDPSNGRAWGAGRIPGCTVGHGDRAHRQNGLGARGAHAQRYKRLGVRAQGALRVAWKRWVSEYGGARSTPSGLLRKPSALPAWPLWPYCQTILFVRGSTTMTRSLRSSLASTSPLGRGSASEGWSSCWPALGS